MQSTFSDAANTVLSEFCMKCFWQPQCFTPFHSTSLREIFAGLWPNRMLSPAVTWMHIDLWRVEFTGGNWSRAVHVYNQGLELLTTQRSSWELRRCAKKNRTLRGLSYTLMISDVRSTPCEYSGHWFADKSLILRSDWSTNSTRTPCVCSCCMLLCQFVMLWGPAMALSVSGESVARPNGTPCWHSTFFGFQDPEFRWIPMKSVQWIPMDICPVKFVNSYNNSCHLFLRFAASPLRRSRPAGVWAMLPHGLRARFWGRVTWAPRYGTHWNTKKSRIDSVDQAFLGRHMEFHGISRNVTPRFSMWSEWNAVGGCSGLCQRHRPAKRREYRQPSGSLRNGSNVLDFCADQRRLKET